MENLALRAFLWIEIQNVLIPICNFRFLLSFSTAADLEQCAQAIKEAKKEAPSFVRLANGKDFSSEKRPIGEKLADWDRRKVGVEYQTKVEKWRKEMEQIFGKLFCEWLVKCQKKFDAFAIKN